MFKCRKKFGKQINAYRLGDNNPVLNELQKAGKLTLNADGTYAVLSQEAALAGSNGQIAEAFDYIKIDSTGYPYPNKRAWFEPRHRHIEGDVYEQIPEILDAWSVDEPDCAELRFLIDQKGLTVNPDDPEHYFSAPLWGTLELAAKDAIIVFYGFTRENGNIVDADFNFVARAEFYRVYELV